MRHSSTDLPIACVTCRAEIAGAAFLQSALPYCCAGCAVGGPCTCSYDEDVPDGDADGQAAPESGAVNVSLADGRLGEIAGRDQPSFE
jgi:hypothetical protein